MVANVITSFQEQSPLGPTHTHKHESSLCVCYLTPGTGDCDALANITLETPLLATETFTFTEVLYLLRSERNKCTIYLK